MNFQRIIPNSIKYTDDNLIYYLGKPLIIQTDLCISNTGITENDGKYYIILQISKELYEFIKRIDDVNKIKLQTTNYDNNTWKTDTAFYLKVKIPRRYNKFEVNVKSSSIYLATIFDVKELMNLKCKIQFSNIWTINDLGGCLINMKEIEIL